MVSAFYIIHHYQKAMNNRINVYILRCKNNKEKVNFAFFSYLKIKKTGVEGSAINFS